MRYAVCMFGYWLSFILGFAAICVAAVGDPIPFGFRILTGSAVFGFGWCARVFYERADEEFHHRWGDEQ